jgi:hypothetical protein
MWWPHRPQSARPNCRGRSVALDDELAADFRSEFTGADTFFSLFDEQRPLDTEVLGYEVVGLEADFSFHSWHCHGYAGQVRRELGVGIDQTGLLSSLDDGRRVLEYLRTRPARDAPYQIPWTVVALAATPASEP